MSIRLAKDSDLKSLVNIYNQAILTKRCTADTDTFTVESRTPWFKSHESIEYPLYVYIVDNKVVGYIHLSPYRPGRSAMRFTAEVSYYIHSDYHRRGIGSELMIFIIKKAKQLRYKSLIAILLEFNDSSTFLLKKHSFSEWGRLPNIADFDGIETSHLYYGLKL